MLLMALQEVFENNVVKVYLYYLHPDRHTSKKVYG